MMEVNQELTEKYKGKKYQRPTDHKVMVISHILQTDFPDREPYFEAIFNLDKPESGSTGTGSCALELLHSLKEIE